MRIPFVLLAEDDEDDRFLFAQAIEAAGPNINYTVVGNGREVITMLESDFFSLPDYILLDLNMPLLNGLECLCAIKGNPRWNGCTVIVYSTTMEKQAEMQLLTAGASACFVKPAGVGALADVLKKMLAL